MSEFVVDAIALTICLVIVAVVVGSLVAAWKLDHRPVEVHHPIETPRPARTNSLTINGDVTIHVHAPPEPPRRVIDIAPVRAVERRQR